MSEDELRKRILARRARFVAASLVAGIAASEACSSPQPCLFPTGGYPPGTEDAEAPLPVLPDATGPVRDAGDEPSDSSSDVGAAASDASDATGPDATSD